MDRQFESAVDLTAKGGTTPLSIADAVIRECPEKEWLEDIIYFLQCYIDRTWGEQHG